MNFSSCWRNDLLFCIFTVAKIRNITMRSVEDTWDCKKWFNRNERCKTISMVSKISLKPFRGQFHQRSTCSFYVCKFCVQLFCAYILGWYFTGARLLTQRLSLERWWKWPLVSSLPTFYEHLFAPIFLRKNSTTLFYLCMKKLVKCWWKWSLIGWKNSENRNKFRQLLK
jgi:hypothetical protein